jgi:hypothetical protein
LDQFQIFKSFLLLNASFTFSHAAQRVMRMYDGLSISYFVPRSTDKCANVLSCRLTPNAPAATNGNKELDSSKPLSFVPMSHPATRIWTPRPFEITIELPTRHTLRHTRADRQDVPFVFLTSFHPTVATSPTLCCLSLSSCPTVATPSTLHCLSLSSSQCHLV